MLAYLIFYLSQLGLILIARTLGLKNNKYLLLFLISLAICFAGFRGDIGTDVIAYRTFYDGIGANDGEIAFEPLFLMIAMLGNAIGLPSQFLIISVAVLQGLFIYLILKRIAERDFFYLLFIATFFVYLQMNIIRVGLALCIVTYALVLNEQRNKSSIPVYVIGILTHVTAMFALPLFSKRWYQALPIVIVIIFIFQEFFLKKLMAYFIGEDVIGKSSEFVGIGFLLSLAIIAYCITTEKKWGERSIRISFFAFALFKIAIGLFSAFDRISLVFGMPIFLLLLRTKVKIQTHLALLVLVAYNTYGSLSFIANSDASIEALIADYPGFALLYADTKWLPYEFFWK